MCKLRLIYDETRAGPMGAGVAVTTNQFHKIRIPKAKNRLQRTWYNGTYYLLYCWNRVLCET